MHNISKILLTLSLGLSLTACKKKSIKDKTTKYSHNGGNGYANNYQLSEIRKW